MALELSHLRSLTTHDLPTGSAETPTLTMFLEGTMAKDLLLQPRTNYQTKKSAFILPVVYKNVLAIVGYNVEVGALYPFTTNSFPHPLKHSQWNLSALKVSSLEVQACCAEPLLPEREEAEPPPQTDIQRRHTDIQPDC